MSCSFCGGPFHPATGCAYGPRVVACHACTVSCWEWVRRHTSGKSRRRGVPASGSFYEAAGRHVVRP